MSSHEGESSLIQGVLTFLKDQRNSPTASAADNFLRRARMLSQLEVGKIREIDINNAARHAADVIFKQPYSQEYLESQSKYEIPIETAEDIDRAKGQVKLSEFRFGLDEARTVVSAVQNIALAIADDPASPMNSATVTLSRFPGILTSANYIAETSGKNTFAEVIGEGKRTADALMLSGKITRRAVLMLLGFALDGDNQIEDLSKKPADETCDMVNQEDRGEIQDIILKSPLYPNIFLRIFRTHSIEGVPEIQEAIFVGSSNVPSLT